MVYAPGGVYVADAIEHSGSYGAAADMIEMNGLTDRTPDVRGWMTAEQVYKLFEEHYDKWREAQEREDQALADR